jgi:Fe-S-cluster-containing dehydrogenase component
MSKYAMIIDYKYCTNCHSCEISCRNENDIPLDEWGIKVAEFGPVKLDGKWMWNYVPVPSDRCNLCEDLIDAGKTPPCVLHCLASCLEIVAVDKIQEKMLSAKKTVTCFIP